VSATGQGQTAGANARGTLAFCTDLVGGVTGSPGDTLPNNQGSANVSIVLDASIFIPASPPGQCTLIVFAPGHVAQVGTVGNIAAGTWGWCSSGCGVIATNSSDFTGGVDPQSYTFVRQSDINNEVAALEANPPDPQQALQPQLGESEQFIGTPTCSPNVGANHRAGDVANSVTVTVSYVCTGEVYAPDDALIQAARLLTDQATKSLGAGYALVGTIKTSAGSATLDDQGTVSTAVNAEGIWVYQFTDQARQTLASNLTGDTAQEAVHLLFNTTGVSNVLVQLVGGNAPILPKDVKQIKITVQAVQGL
jgi:hypothetical protein